MPDTETMVTDALIKQLASPLTPCIAQFQNTTPPQWNVHIIAIGAVFFYDDGTNLQVGPIAVDIPGPNGMQALNSPDPSKCVEKVFGAIMVKAPGHDPQPFSKTNQAQPGNCMVLTHFILGPKNNVNKGSRGALDLLNFD